MIRRIPVDALIPGMYLVNLDRPWLDTPFLRHHWLVSDPKDVKTLKESHVQFVEIDTERGQDWSPVEPLPPIEPSSLKPAATIRADEHQETVGSDRPVSQAPLPQTAAGPSSLPAAPVSQDPTTFLKGSPATTENTQPVLAGPRTLTTDPELEVGTKLQLTLKFGRQEIQSMVRLIGWKEQVFLVTDLPYHEGNPVEFRQGYVALVRYVLKGRVLGFRTKIVRGQFIPSPLLFLEYPKQIEQVMLRRTPRVPASLPATLWADNADRSQARCIIRDINISGCCAILPAPFPEAPVGTRVDLKVKLQSDPGVILEGVVRGVSSTRTPTEGLEWKIGIQFVFASQEHPGLRQLEDYVQERLELMTLNHQAREARATEHTTINS